MYKTEISGIAHDGAAVGRINGKVYFIPGALPGGIVEVELDPPARRQRTTATFKKIIQPHPQRRTPPCPQAGRCGGCALQMAAEPLQCQLKTRIVADAMQRIGKIRLPVQMMETAEQPFRYRNKGFFHVDYHLGKAQLGFYAPGSHELIPANDCLLFSKLVNDLLIWLENTLAMTDPGRAIHSIMIRESFAYHELMVVLITATAEKDCTEIAQYLKRNWSSVNSIWQNINSHPRLMLGSSWRHLAGQPHIKDTIGHLQCQISPASFLQVNNLQANRLYSQVRQFSNLQPHDILLDLYCGTGTIGLYMSDAVKQVIGVESNAAAVRDAQENARQAGISNITFYQSPAETWLPRWQQAGHHADLAIVDPPRKGLKRRLIESLVQSKIERITYISCNPATCARDLSIFQSHGYQIKKIQPIDLFPQTSHVETVALLSKLDVDKHISVKIELDEQLDLASAESKATYTQIKEYARNKFELKVPTLYIAQIKKKCGLELRRHYNKLNKEKQVVPQCTHEKEEAIMAAFRHFKMV